MKKASARRGPSEDRVQLLEAARDLALSGQYQLALSNVERQLGRTPADIEAKRVKGNVLELIALDRAQYEAKKLLRFPSFRQARRLYEEILEKDPQNTLGLTDLGDHFKYLQAFDQAVSYYDRCIECLRRGEFRLSWNDEVKAVFDSKIEVAEARAESATVAALRAECAKLLAKPPAKVQRT